MGRVGGYDVGYDACFRTTNFATALGRLDIVRVSGAMVPPPYNQSKQHTFPMPHSHHHATLSLRHTDVGNVGCYDVGYDDCAHTTNFATAPVHLDIIRVSNAMVPPADNQPKQHILSMPPSHHWETLSLRCADVWNVGGYDVGYNECFCTTDFATALVRLYIARVSDAMVPPPGDQ